RTMQDADRLVMQYVNENKKGKAVTREMLIEAAAKLKDQSEDLAIKQVAAETTVKELVQHLSQKEAGKTSSTWESQKTKAADISQKAVDKSKKLRALAQDDSSDNASSAPKPEQPAPASASVSPQTTPSGVGVINYLSDPKAKAAFDRMLKWFPPEDETV